MKLATCEPVTALIADDEPLLLSSLRGELQRAWPELSIVAEASNGKQALQRLQEPGISVAFLDIQMPGMTGLDVASKLVEHWSEGAAVEPVSWPPLLVFVTAYAEFALEAFESAAVDYVLKPVSQDRLSLTVSKLQARLHERSGQPAGIDKTALQALAWQLTQLAGEQPAQPPLTPPRQAHSEPHREPPAPPAVTHPHHLKLIRASVGDAVRMIPIDQVVLFEASDKYVVVHTLDGESLIRESLRELSSQLDSAQFQQIHRSSIVNMQAVQAALRDAHGKIVLQLKGIKKQPVVSRHYAHLFKAM